jgi:murein L,D-transpeptidase YcbB/YkuD
VNRWLVGAVCGLTVLICFVSFTNAPPASHAAPVFDGAALRVRIDVSDRRLYLERDGESIRSWPVAVGTKNHPTPRGSYGIRHMVWNPRWVPPESDWAKQERPREPGDPKNPMGRVKIFFREPTYYIHGTNAESSLGSAASHGCIRMSNDGVIELARLLIDNSGPPIEPGLIRRLINNVRHTKEINLTRTVPVVVQT